MNGNILLVFFFLQFFFCSFSFKFEYSSDSSNAHKNVNEWISISLWVVEQYTHTKSDMTKVQTLHHRRTRCSALKSVQAGIKTTTTTRPIMPNSATKPHQMATEMKFYSHKIMCTTYMYPVSVYVCSSYAARLFCCCIIVFVMCRSTQTHPHTHRELNIKAIVVCTSYFEEHWISAFISSSSSCFAYFWVLYQTFMKWWWWFMYYMCTFV